MNDVDALYPAPEGAKVDFLEAAALLRPGVAVELIEIIPGTTSLLEMFRRFGVVVELEGPDEVEYRIALC